MWILNLERMLNSDEDMSRHGESGISNCAILLLVCILSGHCTIEIPEGSKVTIGALFLNCHFSMTLVRRYLAPSFAGLAATSNSVCNQSLQCTLRRVQGRGGVFGDADILNQSLSAVPP